MFKAKIMRVCAVMTFVLVALLAVAGLVACNGKADLKSIGLDCDKTEYEAGESFDRGSLTVTAFYSDGSERTVSDYTVEPSGALAVTDTKVTVSYTEDGKTATAELAVTVTEAAHTHTYGAEYSHDKSGHWKECLGCHEPTETEEHAWKPQEEVLEEPDCTTPGRKKVTCSVCGYSEEQQIDALQHKFTVPHYDSEGMQHWFTCSRENCGEESDKESHSFTLAIEDYVSEWYVGDVFSLEGATATETCRCGYSKSIDVNDITISKTDALTEEDDGTEVVLSHGDATFTVTVTVLAKYVTEIAVEGDVDFALGAVAVPEETYLTVTYNSGTSERVLLTADMIEDLDTSQSGSRVFTVLYEDLTCGLSARIGYDKTAQAYYLGSDYNIGTKYKVQVENDDFVDMSEAQLQGNASNKFEETTTLTDESVVPNNAEGSSTSNISVRGNKIILRFAATEAGSFKLGLRAQSGSGSGRSDEELSNVFTLTVNGAPTPIAGTVEKASQGETNWKDMLHWTVLETVAQGDFKVGRNEIVLTYTKEAGTNRLPNLDYFTVEISEASDVELEQHTLTLVGGTFADGGASNTKELKYGEPIPSINWTAENRIGYQFGNDLYVSIGELFMPNEPVTLKAVTVEDATMHPLPAEVRYNVGATDKKGKTSQAGNTTPETETVQIYKEGDGVKYTFSDVASFANARGFTTKGNINFGSGSMLVFVAVVNRGTAELKGVSYGTEFGIVEVGNVASGATATGAAILTGDGSDHWTNIFWEGQLSELCIEVAVYSYIAK